MSDKDITIQQLEEQKKELNEKLEHYEFQGPSDMIQKIEDELFEVNDTIKKLNA
jgi:prefoldin subunit 5